MISRLRFYFYFGGRKFEKQAVARAGKVFNLAKEIIFILPDDPEQARESAVIAEYFKEKRKRIIAVSVNDSASLVPAGLYHEIIVLQMKKLSKYKLPPKPVKHLLESQSADLVIDLSGSDFPFFRYAARTIPASFYAGIEKQEAEKFFDFIYRPGNAPFEGIYPGFLNSITMFGRD